MADKEKLPQYSVLMSVYAKDNADYLKIAIESMLNQTVMPEQFVLVKDGVLTEQLDEVISEYEKSNSIFTIVESEKNMGLGKALDLGMKFCRNELVARMDADDISLPERCEKELNLFVKHENLAICGCNIDEFYDDPDCVETIRRVPADYEGIVKFIKRRQPFNHPTVMYKKSEVLRCGGYGELRRKQDFDLFSRMINMGCYALNIDESLLKFRADNDNYKRRKSWSYVSSSIKVGWINLKRGYCSCVDFAYIFIGQMVIFLLPVDLMKKISDKILRERA